MLDLLCSFIRETGVSDSGAAARAGVHPSTVSRWKRDSIDLAILLRSAREEFRQVQFDIIEREAEARQATSWRAAAWILERVFPEDYAPRARERARFLELYEARCAAEVAEGETIGQSDEENMRSAPERGAGLQNVQKSPEARVGLRVLQPALGDALHNLQKSAPIVAGAARAAGMAAVSAGPARELSLDDARRGDATDLRFREKPLQNVQKSPLAGAMRPQGPVAVVSDVAFGTNLAGAVLWR